MWVPGVVVCDSCAAMMSLAGRSGHSRYPNAHNIVFDFDLSQNHHEDVNAMTFRRIGHYHVGEQPLDRIRHRFQQLKEQYVDLAHITFDERGIPSTPAHCEQMRKAYIHHVQTAHVAKNFRLDDYSLWRQTHDPCLVAMMNQSNKRPPALSRMKKIMETPNALDLFEAHQCKLQQIMLLRPEFNPTELLKVSEDEMESYLERHDRHADCERTWSIWKNRPNTTKLNARKVPRPR